MFRGSTMAMDPPIFSLETEKTEFPQLESFKDGETSKWLREIHLLILLVLNIGNGWE